MELVEILAPNFTFLDQRGDLVQLVRDGWKQVNYIESKKGVIRGNHFHKLNREAFYVISGRFRLTLQNNDIKEECLFQKGDMFLINPLVVHSFEFDEDTQLISLYDRGVEIDEDNKDIYIA